jgi:type III secretory pathway component EscS
MCILKNAMYVYMIIWPWVVELVNSVMVHIVGILQTVSPQTDESLQMETVAREKR